MITHYACENMVIKIIVKFSGLKFQNRTIETFLIRNTL